MTARATTASDPAPTRIVPLHMLKFDPQPERRTRACAISIATHRDGAAYLLKDSPGPKIRLAEAVERAYRGARLEASEETRLPLRRFREACPYTLDEIGTRGFAINPDDRAL